MILSDRDLVYRQEREHIIEGFVPGHVTPVGYDLRIAYFSAAGSQVSFTFCCLRPGESIFAASEELVRLPDSLAARVVLRNTWLRRELSLDAPEYQPGIHTRVYFRIFNLSQSPVLLRQGDMLATIMFEPLSSPAQHPYGGKYSEEIEFGELKVPADQIRDVHAAETAVQYAVRTAGQDCGARIYSSAAGAGPASAGKTSARAGENAGSRTMVTGGAHLQGSAGKGTPDNTTPAGSEEISSGRRSCSSAGTDTGTGTGTGTGAGTGAEVETETGEAKGAGADTGTSTQIRQTQAEAATDRLPHTGTGAMGAGNVGAVPAAPAAAGSGSAAGCVESDAPGESARRLTAASGPAVPAADSSSRTARTAQIASFDPPPGQAAPDMSRHAGTAAEAGCPAIAAVPVASGESVGSSSSTSGTGQPVGRAVNTSGGGETQNGAGAKPPVPHPPQAEKEQLEEPAAELGKPAVDRDHGRPGTAVSRTDAGSSAGTGQTTGADQSTADTAVKQGSEPVHESEPKPNAGGTPAAAVSNRAAGSTAASSGAGQGSDRTTSTAPESTGRSQVRIRVSAAGADGKDGTAAPKAHGGFRQRLFQLGKALLFLAVVTGLMTLVVTVCFHYAIDPGKVLVSNIVVDGETMTFDLELADEESTCRIVDVEWINDDGTISLLFRASMMKFPGTRFPNGKVAIDVGEEADGIFAVRVVGKGRSTKLLMVDNYHLHDPDDERNGTGSGGGAGDGSSGDRSEGDDGLPDWFDDFLESRKNRPTLCSAAAGRTILAG